MRILLIAATGFILFSAEKCADSNNKSVTLTLTRTESYCGGMEPPEDLIQELNTPKPVLNKKVFVLDDSRQCVDSFYSLYTTKFRTALKSGRYTIHLIPNAQDLDSIMDDEKRCAQAYVQRSLSTFDIQGDTSLTANLHFGCNPCLPPP
jgi:hypothetical protein